MTWPILVFRGLYSLFGTRSYLPYLLVLWATHVGVVVLARCWMRRFGVSAWISTLMTILLLVFGALRDLDIFRGIPQILAMELPDLHRGLEVDHAVEGFLRRLKLQQFCPPRGSIFEQPVGARSLAAQSSVSLLKTMRWMAWSSPAGSNATSAI